jgi:O-succinylbenzoate synthase
MKLAFSLYKLKGKPPFKDREGALLRIEFEGGKLGYGDIHPWLELGDKPLNEQVALLQKGVFTPLTTRSLYFAKMDAEARAQNKYLFDDVQIPESHKLVLSPDEPIPQTFTTVKIKTDPSTDLIKIISKLPMHLKIRIDFNNKHTFESFSRWIPTIKEFWNRIDFIEDPFPYHKEQWDAIPVPVAGDFQQERGKIAVVKPAVEDYTRFLQSEKVIITSYLDHPFGQMCAAYTAAKMKKMHPNKLGVCGLLSHTAYETNAFSERLQNNGPFLSVPSSGTGFGFDDILKGMKWND